MKNLETYINGKKKRHNLVYTSKVDTLLLNKNIFEEEKKQFASHIPIVLTAKKIEKKIEFTCFKFQ